MVQSNQIKKTIAIKALEYSKKGLHVFPCVKQGKQPATKNGMNDATTDEEVIKSWWKKNPNCNIGINLSKSGLVVIDIDVGYDSKGNKKNGDKEFQKILANNKLPNTPTSVTGSLGKHIFFKAASENSFLGKVRDCSYVDIKYNGYIIAEPSIHPNGTPYKWEDGKSIFDIEPADIPDFLIEKMIKKNIIIDNISIPSKSYLNQNRKYYPEIVTERCNFLKHWMIDRKSLPEPEWFAGIGVLAYTANGKVFIHKVSKAYPAYDISETDEKITRVLNNSAPFTCEGIQSMCGDNYCKGCGFNGYINSPISLGIPEENYSIRSEEIPFPVESLPEIFREYAIEISTSMKAPIEFIALALLVLASALIGSSSKIQINPEWLEPSLLWGCLVGPPGSKKTPVINIIKELIEPIMAELVTEYKKQKEAYLKELEKYKIEKVIAEKENKDAKRVIKPLPEEPEKPIMKLLYTVDTTTEALVELIEASPKGILVLSDEYSMIIRSMNQYKKGGSDRSLYLESWSSTKNHIVTRKGNVYLIIKILHISTLGGIQPDLLKEIMLNSNANIADGFIERLLFAYPEYNDDGRITRKEVDQSLKQAVQNTLMALNDIEFKDKPDIYTLTEDSFNKLDDYCAELQSVINSKIYPDSFNNYFSKQKGYAARLANVLHIVKKHSQELYSNEIDPDTMQQAIDLSRYFIGQALIVHNIIHKKLEVPECLKIIDYMDRKNLDSVTSRHIQTNLRNVFAGSKAIKDAFLELKALGKGIVPYEEKGTLFIKF